MDGLTFATAYAADQRDSALEDLARILDAEGMTNTLDMLAGMATDERTKRLVQDCANKVEHRL